MSQSWKLASQCSSRTEVTTSGGGDVEDPVRNVVENRFLIYGVMFTLALATRAAVGLHPYSGENTPPMYGDFEAQRHWMEVAYNLPPSEWYVHTPNNNLSYWGLDYPPLSGHFSKAFGYYLSYVDPRSVAVNLSHGYERANTRFAMRNTVLFCDATLLFPALYLATNQQRLITLAVALTSPALLLVDHAHFQYNGVSAALLLFSVHMLNHQVDDLAAILFTACVLFKQTNLYYALVMACVMISRFLRIRGIMKKFYYAGRIGTAIAGTLMVIFAPLIVESREGSMNINLGGVVHVIRRVFPFSRGLFEDKVANVWCTLSIILPHKFRPTFVMSESQLLSACTVATVATSVPFCLSVVKRPWCTKRIQCALTGVALTTFLWSYQVHEKQILISLVPLSLLHADMPMISGWVSTIGTFSLLPLLLREKSTGAYISCIGLHVLVVVAHLLSELEAFSICSSPFNILVNCSAVITVAGLHMVVMTMQPPPKLPDLYTVAVSTVCCLQFCLAYLILLKFLRGEKYLLS